VVANQKGVEVAVVQSDDLLHQSCLQAGGNLRIFFVEGVLLNVFSDKPRSCRHISLRPRQHELQDLVDLFSVLS
jgi:hypothetical protein